MGIWNYSTDGTVVRFLVCIVFIDVDVDDVDVDCIRRGFQIFSVSF